MLIWKTNGTKDSPPCPKCEDMAGRKSGDGWLEELGPEAALWYQDDAGEWHRRPTGGLRGAPPLHPNCRCEVIEVAPW